MAKIFIEVVVPGNAKTYEFAMDNAITIERAKDLVIDQITEIENMELYPDRRKALFCSVDLKGMLRGVDTLAGVGIKSGYKLILI